MTMKHRKRRKSYNEPGHAHFLTFSCQNRWPLLSKDRSREWVIDALDKARTSVNFDIWAYVIMPEHVHVLIWPRDRQYQMRRALGAIKRPVSTSAKQYLIETGQTSWLRKLTVQVDDKAVFRFWLPGGGFDENLWSEYSVEEVIDYIHANPVRRGLVKRPTDWYWSSARWHAGQHDGPLRIDPVRV
jgi:putative transposase